MSKSKKLDNKVAFIVNQKGSFLTSTQKSVINYIGSYSNDLHKYQESISEELNISIRTFQRAIKKLIAIGLIERKYRLFKKVTYKLVSIEKQIAIVKNILQNGIQSAFNFVDKMRDKIKKRSMKSSVLSPVSDLITTLVSEPIKENNLKENNIINIDREKGKDFNNYTKDEKLNIRKEMFLKQLREMQLSKS